MPSTPNPVLGTEVSKPSPSLPMTVWGRGVFEFALRIDPMTGRPLTVDSGDPGVLRFGVEIRSPTGLTLGQGTLELPDLGSDSASTQDGLETAWGERRKDLAKLEDGVHGPQVVLPADSRDLLPPLVWTERGCFALPCPSCGQPLVNCRDGEVLSRRGLPTPGEGLDVFLICANTCGEADEPEVTELLFVAQWQLSEEHARAGCLALEDLRSRIGMALSQEEASSETENASRDKELPGLDGGEWHVLTDRELPYWLLQTSGEALDSFADRLGGRTHDDVPISPSDHYLMAFQGSGLDAVEIFTLKLILFRQILDSVACYHRILERPHLDLHPGHFLVNPLAGVGSGLPSLWSFRTQLVGTSGARPRRLAPDVLWIAPPERPRTPYASPAVRRACLVKPQIGQLLAEQVTSEADGGFRLEAKLRDPSGLFPRPADDDWLRIRFRGSSFGQIRELLFRPDPRSFGGSGALSVISEPMVLAPDLAERWSSIAKVDLGEVEYQIFPNLDSRSDRYALGMLLLRLLLADDEQDLGLLESELQENLFQTRRDGEAVGDEADGHEEQVVLQAADLLADHPHLFAPHHVFWHRHERREDRPNAIPKGLWEEALGLALGWLITCSEAASGSEPPPLDSPGGALARVDDLLRRCRVLMFGLQPVHLEVHSVVAEMLTSLE